MRALLIAWLCLLPIAGHAAAWTPDGCGAEPDPPSFSLSTRAAYNDAVARVNAYQRDARAYSDCVLKQAHADESTISRTAQNRIADIQTTAVATQQDIYGRMAAQAAAFKAAAARLKER